MAFKKVVRRKFWEGEIEMEIEPLVEAQRYFEGESGKDVNSLITFTVAGLFSSVISTILFSLGMWEFGILWLVLIAVWLLYSVVTGAICYRGFYRSLLGSKRIRSKESSALMEPAKLGVVITVMSSIVLFFEVLLFRSDQIVTLFLLLLFIVSLYSGCRFLRSPEKSWDKLLEAAMLLKKKMIAVIVLGLLLTLIAFLATCWLIYVRWRFSPDPRLPIAISVLIVFEAIAIYYARKWSDIAVRRKFNSKKMEEFEQLKEDIRLGKVKQDHIAERSFNRIKKMRSFKTLTEPITLD
ncbi:MAG: hypothetical protein ACE5KV_06395 [Thermoplasmata archaeon]